MKDKEKFLIVIIVLGSVALIISSVIKHKPLEKSKPKSTQKIVLKEQTEGNLSGVGKLVTKESNNSQKKFDSCQIAQIPVSGTQKVTYTQNGKVVNQTETKIAGITTVEIVGDGIKVDTKFEDEKVIEIPLPEEPKPQRWRLGGQLSGNTDFDFAGEVYLKYDLVSSKHFKIPIGLGIERNNMSDCNKIKVTVGVEIAF